MNPYVRPASICSFLLVPLLVPLLVLPFSGCGNQAPTRAGQAAVVALRAERWEEALLEARAAEARGNERFAALHYFIRGSVAYARSLEWEAASKAGDPEAGKMAYQRAEDALAYWQMAAASRLDWPAAQRNVERGLLRMQALRESKTDRRDPPERTPPPDPTAPPDPENEDAQASTAEVETQDLPARKVAGVLEVLVSRERRKRALRRAQRAKQGTAVERDW